MAVRIIRLGSPRLRGEGLRIGTVRRPPRGVRKSELAADDWYDIWYPELAPSPATVKLAQRASTPAQWAQFMRQYRREMASPERARTIALLAALSHQTNFSVGCYCEDEQHCHRSTLKALLIEHGADVKTG